MRLLPRGRKLNRALCFGGISIALEGGAAGRVPARLRPFLCGAARPLARCTGRLGPLVPLRRGRVLFDSGGVWRVEEGRGGIRLVLRSGGPAGRPYHALELDRELRRGRARLDPRGLRDGPQPFLLRSPLDELWTSFLLMRGRGILLHACGLLVGGRVHVFVGESGAGKSTLARLFERHGCGEILSDDRLILRPSRGGFSVFGTPWHGQVRFGSPAHGRLVSLNFLQQAPRSRLVPLGKAAAVVRLFSNCFLAGWPLDLDFVLGFCRAVVEATECRLFRFVPDGSALHWLELF